MIVRLILGLVLWITATIALRTGVIEPGVGAIALLIAVVIAFGPWLLRLAALAADIATGI